jgi:uncharacterized protein YbcI
LERIAGGAPAAFQKNYWASAVNNEKSRRDRTPEGAPSRRLTLQLTSRRRRVAFQLVRRNAICKDQGTPASGKPQQVISLADTASRQRIEMRLSLQLIESSNQQLGTPGIHMKTQGEIEAAICEGIRRFKQEYMGRGPKAIHTHLIGDLVIVRLQGVLTAAEQQLVKALPFAKGRDLLKEVRTQLIETARPLLEALVQDVVGVQVRSLHHDISTVTGEEVVVFTLAQAPAFREMKARQSH